VISKRLGRMAEKWYIVCYFWSFHVFLLINYFYWLMKLTKWIKFFHRTILKIRKLLVDLWALLCWKIRLNRFTTSTYQYDLVVYCFTFMKWTTLLHWAVFNDSRTGDVVFNYSTRSLNICLTSKYENRCFTSWFFQN